MCWSSGRRRSLRHRDHPGDAEAVGEPAEARRSEGLAPRHRRFAAFGQRGEGFAGRGLVGQRQAEEKGDGFFAAAAEEEVGFDECGFLEVRDEGALAADLASASRWNGQFSLVRDFSSLFSVFSRRRQVLGESALCATGMEPDDSELLRRYVRDKDEDAFSLLVRRHIDLVYATAVRTLGGASAAASDVAQEVFLSLARKAAWLGAEGSLAGWLHRAAVLAARQRMRTEARRQQRDKTAAALAKTMESSESESVPVIRDLDEALLELEDNDRRALVLRYLEQRSLRDVGECLRIGEDAAQKRVAKALGRLSQCLARRGYPVATSAGLAQSLQAAVLSAPHGVAGAVAANTLTTVGAAGGLSWPLAAALATPLMALTHVQTAAVCLLTVALPLGYQWHALGTERAEQQQLAAALRLARADFHREDLRRAHQQRRIESMYRGLLWARKDLELRERAAEQISSTPTAIRYAWFDQAPFVRVPKLVLADVRFAATRTPDGRGDPPMTEPVTADGSVSESLAETLNLTPADQAAVREGFESMAIQFRQLEAQHLRIVTEGPPREFGVGQRESTTVMLGAFPEAGAALKTELRDRLMRSLGEDKAAVVWTQTEEVFRSNFREFGALDEVYTLAFDPREGMAVWNGLRRPDEPRFESWGNSTGLINLGGYPEPVRSYFQRWLEERQTRVPASTESPQRQAP